VASPDKGAPPARARPHGFPQTQQGEAQAGGSSVLSEISYSSPLEDTNVDETDMKIRQDQPCFTATDLARAKSLRTICSGVSDFC